MLTSSKQQNDFSLENKTYVFIFVCNEQMFFKG